MATVAFPNRFKKMAYEIIKLCMRSNGITGNTKTITVVFSDCKNRALLNDILGPLTKPGSVSGSDSGSDRIPDRIGLVCSLLVQKYYFEKSCFNKDTGGPEFFFRATCVTNKEKKSFLMYHQA